MLPSRFAMHARAYREVGRYAICDEIAAGGMARVHLGRLLGPAGFARTVAIKCLHSELARDPSFVSMLLDEARLAGRIRSPHVAAILDVVFEANDIFLVMEYVHGDSISKLIHATSESGARIPLEITSSILSGALHGLHAAHCATDEQGSPLRLIHRDVSPQNILVGTDGLARVVDFGIAKAAGRLQTTSDGQLKGKINYMAPEQFEHGDIDHRVDIRAAAVVLWEMLTGKRMFGDLEPASVMRMILQDSVPPSLHLAAEIPGSLAQVVSRGMSRDPAGRYSTAREMALAMEAAIPPAAAYVVGEWVERTLSEALRRRSQTIARMEASLLANHDQASSPGASNTVTTPTIGDVNAADSLSTVPTTVYAGARGAPAQDASAGLAVPSRATGMLRSHGFRPGLVAGIAVGILFGAGALLSRACLRSDPQRGLSDPASTDPAVSVSLSTPRPEPCASASAPEPPARSTPSASAAASPSVPIMASPPATPGVRPSSRTPAFNCTPPYVLDRDGLRHLKPECLGTR